ncbi:MAG TPA: phosphate ABC transporter permease subunit PstC [Solirubrobacteraceae bacterium]|nr:phosphate ABC transporter permease subunit PstC [Solirubrobacteraceae bacterium]
MDRHPLTPEPPRGRKRRWATARTDQRVELTLGALAVAALVLIGAMLVTVLIKAWPSFSHNGLSWFGPGGDIETQFRAMAQNKALPGHSILYFRAWPLIWATVLTTGSAVLIALLVSTLAAIFLTEFAPMRVRQVLDPVIRLLAGVPSVIYGLIGILVIAPYLDDHLIGTARRESVSYVVQLNGADVMTASLVLTVMILPIMVAITAGALASVPASWREGSLALGANRWRTIWRVSLRTARPAIVAATVLATARALGEAVMLAMLGGGRSFAPNLLDGLTALFEPVRPLAAAIFQNSEGLTIAPLGHTVYAIGAVLLVSAAMLSLAGWAAKQQFNRYGLRG